MSLRSVYEDLRRRLPFTRFRGSSHGTRNERKRAPGRVESVEGASVREMGRSLEQGGRSRVEETGWKKLNDAGTRGRAALWCAHAAQARLTLSPDGQSVYLRS
jgi:hypothetical protein